LGVSLVKKKQGGVWGSTGPVGFSLHSKRATLASFARKKIAGAAGGDGLKTKTNQLKEQAT